jgi:hypothetical protein
VFVWLDDTWVAMKWCEEMGGAWHYSYTGRIVNTDPGEIEWWTPYPEPPEPEVRG